MNWVKFYLDVVASERTWSWAIVGVTYLVGTILMRLAVFHQLVRKTKKIDPRLYLEVRNLYLKNSAAGWIVFSLSFLLVIGAWIGWKNATLEKGPLALFCLLLPLLFFVSIVLHLIAYGEALLAVLRQRTGVEREF